MRLAFGVLALLLWTTCDGFGQRYAVLPVADSPRDIGVLFQDSTSRIWVGSKDNVYSFDGSHFYSIRQYGFPAEAPKTIAEDSEGGIWIGTQSETVQGHPGPSGLYRYHASRVEKMISGDILSVASVAPGLMLVSMGRGNSGSFGDIYRMQSSEGKWTARLVASNSARQITVDMKGMSSIRARMAFVRSLPGR